MKRNVELLERTMRHILDHPERHDQAQWIAPCGTAACFAGWSVLLSPNWEVFDYRGVWLARRVGEPEDVWAPSEAAKVELGVTPDEAAILFDVVNTRPMLQLMVKDLVNGDDLREVEDYRVKPRPRHERRG